MEQPTVSVILAIRNEAAFIRDSLGAVLKQDYPAERLQVLVADGQSTDGTREILTEMAREDPRIEWFDNPRRTVAPGLNRALQRTRGEIIVRVDGHTLIEPDYVRQCVHALQTSEASNVGGRMRAEGRTPTARAIARATSTRFGVGNAAFHYLDEEAWVDTVYLGAWRRRTFEELGLFDEELTRNQDDEFNYRLRAASGRILLSPKIRSRYFNRASLGSLWRQYFQYGLYKVRVLQKHRRQMQPRQFVPPLFVAGTLFCVAGALLTPWTGLFAAALILAWAPYAALTLIASWVAGRGAAFGERVLMPLIFPSLHLSYGSGFLVGLLRFAGRWNDRQGQVPKLDPVTPRGTTA